MVLPIWNYPGWRIDPSSSVQTGIVDENGLIAIRLPEGRQKVKMTFFPENFYLLLGLTFASVLSAGAMICLKRLNFPAADSIEQL